MNERKAFKTFALPVVVFFFFFSKSQRRELCEEPENCRHALIRLPGRLVSWKPGVNSDGAFFFFLESRDQMQVGGCGVGEVVKVSAVGMESPREK